MKRIFALIGSEKGVQSNTYQYAKLILDQVNQIYKGSLEIEVVTSGEVRIDKCQECQQCFSAGVCQLDQQDDMEYIKKKMLETDLIIWGSGVYFQHVSSEMKNYIDRLAYWSHIFAMAGKQCIIITSSGSNGNDLAEAYLKRVSVSLGMQFIGSSYCRVLYPMELQSLDLLEKRIRQITNVIVDALEERITVTSNPFQEKLFTSMKEIYKTHLEFVKEIEEWKRQGFFECNTFNELIWKKRPKIN